jgi:PHP domain
LKSSKRVKFRQFAWAILAVVSFLPSLRGDAIDRLQPAYLKALHEATEAFRHDRQTVSLPSTWTDYRAVMHVHSLLSHDSRSKLEEIVAAAKKLGIKVICFTEHPNPPRDYIKEGHRGMVDGVLLIPGYEFNGLLAFPKQSIPLGRDADPQARVNAVRKTGGQAFLCHLEERMDWDLKNLTGSEIYNLHADFKDETRLLKSMRSAAGLLTLLPASRQYPQETMAALMDYPADYLRRYDELCLKEHLTGIAANDSHHNTGFKGTVAEDGQVQLVDALGEKRGKVDPKKYPLLKFLMPAHPKKGDVVIHLDLDPYERSFHHVSTHLFLKEQTEPAVREALEAGRAYVAFEWIADASGFNFQAVRGDRTFEMGSDVPLGSGVTLRSVSPLPARFRLIRNGKEVHTALGRTYEHAVTQAGNYRLEVWLNLPENPQIWILSNPIFVRDVASAKKLPH